MKYIIPLLSLLLLFNVCQAKDKEYPGTKTLEDALVAKLLTVKLVEMENVAKVTYQAINEGLSESDEKLARQLIQTVYLERAITLAEGLQSGRVETQHEINMFVNIGLEALKHVVESCKPAVQDDTQMNIDYTDVYWYIKAILLAFTDNSQAYQIALTKAKELNKDNSNRMANLIVMEVQQEENASKRLTTLQEALKTYPESNSIKKVLVDIYFQLNKIDEAIKLIEDLLQDEPDNPAYLIVMADYHFNLGEYELCLKELKMVELTDPKNAEILTHEALCALFLGDKEQFMSYSKKALRQEPNNIFLLLVRASEFIYQKKYEDASTELGNALFFNNKIVSLKVLNAFVEYKLEKRTKDELLKELETLTTDSNLNSDDIRYFCMIFTELKNAPAFLKFLNTVVERFPDNRYVQESMTQMYLNTGQIDKAKEAFEKFLKTKPDNYSLLNNYSWLLSTCPDDAYRDGKKAVELALKAVQLTDGKEAFIISTLAAAYAETGDFDKAIETAQKGIDICDEPDTKQAMTKELDSYKQKKPIREEIEIWKN